MMRSMMIVQLAVFSILATPAMCQNQESGMVLMNVPPSGLKTLS